MARKTDPASVGKGVLICFLYGDLPENEKVFPDFAMNIAQFFVGDLRTVAEHNIAQHRRAVAEAEADRRRQLEVQRQVAIRKQTASNRESQ